MDQIAKTALLAAAFGASVLTVDAVAKDTGRLDIRAARELAVFSRVLARNLREMRVSLAAVEGTVSARNAAGNQQRAAAFVVPH